MQSRFHLFLSKCIKVSILLSLIFIAGTQAQTRFDNSLVPRGLPIRQLGAINDIVQDAQGFIWIAGENGLGRYDGTNLRVYHPEADNPASLPSNYIPALTMGPKGELWIATSGGVCIYHADTETFETIKNVNGQHLLSEVITSLASKNDDVYVGSTHGLNIIHRDKNTLDTYSSSKPELSNSDANTVNDISVNSHGDVWIATEFGGVARLNPETKNFDYFSHDRNNPDSLSTNHARSIYHDSKDRLWIGTHGGGINLYDPAIGKFSIIEYPDRIGDSRKSVVMDELEDAYGDFWIAVDQQGLLRFDKDLHFIRQYAHSGGDASSLISNQTRVIFEDKNKDLWIGMLPFDISFLDRSKEAIRTYRSDSANPTTLSHSAILTFMRDQSGIVWVGTEGGLNALDPATDEVKRYTSNPTNPKALAANAVLSVQEDVSGNLWVGTWSGGLHFFNRKTEEFKRYVTNPDNPHAISDAFVWKVFRDSDNNIWIGTETGGLQLYRPATDDFEQFKHDPNNPASLSGNFIRDIVEDDQGNLWLASSAGLNIFDRQTKTFRLYEPPANSTGIKANQSFFCLYKDSKGNIWAGGNDKGVIRINVKTGEAKRFDVRNGLQSYTVSSIQEDQEGYIWLATYNGLARLHPQTDEITLVNVEQGLIGSIYNRNAAMLAPSGQLYFGSTEGITVFRPEDLSRHNSIHPIIPTNLKIFNKDVAIGEPKSPLKHSILFTNALELEYADKMFSFNFVMLNFRNPEHNTYAYKLDGFDRDWNYVGKSNNATYTNLDPGIYRFHLKAKTADGQWENMERPIDIRIAPPLWQTWWAYLIYVALIAFSIYGFYAVKRLRAASDTYRELSLTDTLAGAYNRAGIIKVVQKFYKDPNLKSRLCVMIIDIDHFKRVNDERGHNMGDHVIKEVVRLSKANIRSEDCFGRWGGEEFILLSPQASPTTAKVLAEKIRLVIAEHEFDIERPLQVTISIGIAFAAPAESFEETLERADKALYQAKTEGRNRSIFAES